MMASRTKLTVLIVTIAAVAGIAAAWYARQGANEARPGLGPVIARVDGAPIYLAEARSRVEGVASVHSDIEKILGPNWPDAIMQSLVDDKLLADEAAREGIVVTTADVQTSVTNLQQQFGGARGFEAWLARQGMTYAEIERRVRLQLVAARMYEAVTADVAVPVSILRSYYHDHLADYTSGDGGVLPFGTVRPSLRQEFEKERKDTAYQTWMRSIRADADVVIVKVDWWEGLDEQQS